MREKIFQFILKNILIAIAIIFFLWMCFFDENSLTRHLNIQNVLKEQEVDQKRLEKENKKFESTIKLYESDSINPILEKILREDYGLAKEDEIIFKVK